MSALTTLRFIAHSLRGKEGAAIESVVLENEHLRVPADVYQPMRRCRGTVLMLHGMNKEGNKDPRLVSVCHAIARVGYRVVFPLYPLIAKHVVDMQSVQDFMETVKIIVNDQSLCESGRIGIFTASFSGSLSLRAVKHPDIAPHVKGICSIGICYHPDSTFTNILDEPTDDHYAKYISIKNLLRIADELNDELSHALDCAIDDAYMAEESEHKLQAFLPNMTEENRKWMETIFADVESKEKLSGKYARHIELIHSVFMADAELDNLQCAMSLIHSENDEVLHKVESEMLYDTLTQHNIPANLVVTPLLEHADFKFQMKYFKQGIELIKGFNYFFKHI